MPWLLPIVVGSSLVLLVLAKSGIQAAQLLILPIVMLLTVAAAFGTTVARMVVVPIAFLYFSMPAWNLLTAPLQRLTLQVVKVLGPAIGLPLSVSGSMVNLPGGMQFIVTLACSGVGFLVQGLAVAVLLGELEDARLRRRVALALAMGATALVANWIRVLALLQIGYSTRMTSALVTNDHLQFGYVLFAVALVGFVWVATRRPPRAPEIAITEVRQLNLPVPRFYFAAIGALVVAPILITLTAHFYGVPPERALQLPAAGASWSGPLGSGDLSSWRPIFVGAHSERRATYRDEAGKMVDALVIGYPVQQQGRELVNEGNSLLGDGLVQASGALIEGDDVTYLEQVAVDAQGHQFVVWSFYDIGGRAFVTPLFSQLWYGIRSLARPPYSALVALRAPCDDPSCASGRRTLESLIRGVGSIKLRAVSASIESWQGASVTPAPHPARCDTPATSASATQLHPVCPTLASLRPGRRIGART